MLTITPGAAEALEHLRSNIEDLPERAGLRITTDDSDEGEYLLEVVEEPDEDDLVIDGHPLPVFIPKETADDLSESALDGETHGDHVHFGIVDLAALEEDDDEDDSDED
jgi:Fe-S cluster assembly iron-binding protein IscA